MTEPSKTKATDVEPIERATKRRWSEWMTFMDTIGAADLTHAQIAHKVGVELGSSVDNPAWWAQGITVAYEQHSGRRKPGQQADGSFQTSVSRTTALGMNEALEAWLAFAAGDATVGKAVTGAATVGGSAKRKTWRAKAADGTSVLFTSELRPNGKTAVLVTNTRLASQEANEAAKARWTDVLERFTEGL